MIRRRRMICILARVSFTVLLVLLTCAVAAWVMSYRGRYVRGAPASGGWDVQSFGGLLDVSRYQAPVPGLLPVPGLPPTIRSPAPAMGVFIVSPHLGDMVEIGRGTTWGQATTTRYSTLRVRYSFIFFLLGSAMLAAGISWRLTRRPHTPRPGLCPTCGYDLRASPDRCPECGVAVAVKMVP